MKSKWYMVVLVMALALLGISLGKINRPNQEIVIQFEDQKEGESQAEKALESVTKQLMSIGVEELQVVRLDTGILKVVYYSDVGISEVQHLFSKAPLFYFDAISMDKGETPISPIEKPSRVFHLNIHEIQSNHSNDVGLNGILLEAKYTNDPHIKPIFFLSGLPFEYVVAGFSYWKAANCFYNPPEIIQYKSYQIPEVRAGPLV